MKQHMDHKQLLIWLLEKLQNHWLPAEWLLLVIQQHDISQATIDGLLEIITVAAEHATDDQEKQKLLWAKAYLEKIQQREYEEKILEEQEIEALLEAI